MRHGAPSSPDTADAALASSYSKSLKASARSIRPRRGRISHYQRQQQQKSVLQREIVELLEVLEREKARSRKSAAALSPTSSALKKIAIWHLRHRQASEAKREWLQAAVAGKKLLIDDLIGLVHQQHRTMSLFAAQSRGLYDSLVLQPTDELLYAMYIHELDGIYAQTDKVFECCGMGPKEETTTFQHKTFAASGGTASMQCGWKQLFPFHLRQTCDVMWLVAHLLNRQEAREAYEEVKDPERTIAAKFRVTNRLAGDKGGALLHRFVHRRFVEGDREVSVRKSSCVGDGVYRGMQVEETGWCVFRPSATGEGTFGQVCIRQVPLHLHSAREPAPSSAKCFSDFVQNMVRENRERPRTRRRRCCLKTPSRASACMLITHY